MPYNTYYIPSGPTNLNAGFFPGLDFTTIQAYYLDILDGGGNVIGTTPLFRMDGECCDDKVRLHFVNYLGAVDAINFKNKEETHQAKSDRWQRALEYPPDTTKRSQHGQNRFNVKANGELDLTVADYAEEDMAWIDELVDTPMAWREESAAVEAQTPGYIPMIVLDGEVKNHKSEDPFLNNVEVKITYSHDKIIIRN